MLMTPSGSRSNEFGMGMSPQEPPSLQATSSNFNQKVPHKFTPNGLNQQIIPSGNGMDAVAAQRITPGGMLKDFSNGSSQSTVAKLQPKYGTTLNLSGA